MKTDTLTTKEAIFVIAFSVVMIVMIALSAENLGVTLLLLGLGLGLTAIVGLIEAIAADKKRKKKAQKLLDQVK